MKRSKIIIELIKDEINVVQAMNILYLLLQDMKDKKIKKWLDNEINGYKNEKDVPEYRIFKANIKGNYVAGKYKCTNQDIPISPEYIEEYSKIKITAPVSDIINLAEVEKESKEHCLGIPLHQVLVQNISLINGEIISAHRELSIYAHTNLLATLKTKVLKIFIELEKKYGNLDEYYIDFSNKKEENEIVKDINNIIFTDNSIHFGNDNSIENSNVGVGNEN